MCNMTQRLDIQHQMWSIMEGGLYPRELEAAVQEALAPRDGHEPTILDIGSGSGIWCVGRMIDLASLENTVLPGAGRSIWRRNSPTLALSV